MLVSFVFIRILLFYLFIVSFSSCFLFAFLCVFVCCLFFVFLVCLLIVVCVFVCVCTYVCVRPILISAHIYLNAYLSVCVCVYSCMHVSIFLFLLCARDKGGPFLLDFSSSSKSDSFHFCESSNFLH